MRIRSIDQIRGLCILFMLITHAFDFWLDYSSHWLFGLEGITLGSICASGFVFVSGTSFGFSWAMNDQKGISQREQYLKGIASAIVLLVVSFCMNFISSLTGDEGWEELIYWHLFQALAICRFIGLLFVKVKKVHGICLVVILIVFATIFMQAIDYGITTDPLKYTLYVIFYRRLNDYPIFVYFPLFLMGMIIGKEIQNYTSKPTPDLGFLKKWLGVGIIFMIVGVFLGYQLTDIELGWPLVDWVSRYPFAPVTMLPLFTILDTYAWCLFFTGFQICLQMCLFYYMDIRSNSQNSRKAPRKGMLDLFGKYSLTIYMVNMVMYTFPMIVDYIGIWIPTLVLILIFWVLFWLLDKLGKGKISLEYQLGIFSEWLYRKISRLEKRKLPKPPDNRDYQTPK